MTTEEYLSQNMSAVPDLLVQLEKETWQKLINPRMCSGAYQGRLLSAISKMINPRSILELGTFTGYSALCLMEGLALDGKMVSLELNEELSWIHEKYLKDTRMELRYGNALDSLPLIALSEVDLVFVDADKRNYMNYLRILEGGLRSGAWVLLDNVLWSGKVLEPAIEGDIDTFVLQELNQYLAQSSLWETIILPIRDGLTIARRN
jgi:predicted O-methyltransferase YrrM